MLVDPIAVEDIANVAVSFFYSYFRMGNLNDVVFCVQERGAPRAACKALFANVHGTLLETMRDDGILSDLRFPHDWYAASAELEEEARMDGGRGGEPVVGGGGVGGGGGSALGASDEAPAGDTRRRRRVELELESSSDEDDDDDGDARDMGELREVLTR